ncbi:MULTISPECIES: ketopantoate reductase family protein [unclassified Haloarcula]|uniref:ketopantoate reductase family protein n=1 Tax=unclassified Haloarcula TaxID=2624677 RepID=UPI000EF1684E|nr:MULTISPECIES: ketopantoate reductase family protein [unclassified Haloarcula]RLM45130.1 ketopantoate reductase family protein [Haloarcula sp. Atlit-47R]RLM83443.1 ketopantoate reductase family protein [Haloarcula sp. Atlit-7R]
MDIVVVGAGSLGSLVGGLLAREHDVTLVGREPHVGTISEDGLSVVGAEEFRVHPNAQTTVPQGADLALVTVKAHDTAAVAADLADCTLDACLSLQNGMGNEAELAAEVDCPVLAGTCSYGARLREPGTVAFTGRGEVVLGDRDGGRSTVADEVGSAVGAAGIETTVAADMPARLWEKLAVNAGINAVTALARVENGALADSPADAIAADAARETAAVAREQDIDLSDERAVSLVERVVDDTAANHSSMYQDISDGRQTEIDAINGYVVATATAPVPVNETLAGLVRTWERHRER